MRFDGVEDAGVLPEIPPAEPGVLLDVRGPGPDDRLRHGMGTANIASGAPLSDDAIFYVGSLAKQFVAACVALLWRDGVLDLYRPIGTYVPGLPPWGERVHLQHLIHHTAGLPRVYRPSGGIDPSGVPGWGNEDLMDEIRTIPDPARRRERAICTRVTGISCWPRRSPRRQARRWPTWLASGSSSRSRCTTASSATPKRNCPRAQRAGTSAPPTAGSTSSRLASTPWARVGSGRRRTTSPGGAPTSWTTG
jgi:CubicO group peptidase (beta-lactamase class C family)